MSAVSKETFGIFKDDRRFKEEDLQALRDWLNKQPHLPNVNDTKLGAFLHASMYNTTSAKKFIENFYVVRARWPEFSRNRDVLSPRLQIHLQTTIIAELPIRTEEGYAVVYVRLMNTDPDHYDFLTQCKLFDMSALTRLMIFPISSGMIGVLDLNGITFSHLLKLNLADAAKIAYYFQKVHNRATKAIHVVCPGPFLNKLFVMVKPFLTKKMLDKVHLHESFDTLFEHVPKELMPDELGGRAGPVKELHENYMKDLRDNADFLREMEQDKANLSLRPEKRQDLDAIFGIDGTFRKLDID